LRERGQQWSGVSPRVRPFRNPRPPASIPPLSLNRGLIPGRTLVVVINRVALLVGVPLRLAAPGGGQFRDLALAALLVPRERVGRLWEWMV